MISTESANQSAPPGSESRVEELRAPLTRRGRPLCSAVCHWAKRASRLSFICLLLGAVVWFIIPRFRPAQDPEITPGGSDADAAALYSGA
jgi:hypothetical protein